MVREKVFSLLNPGARVAILFSLLSIQRGEWQSGEVDSVEASASLQFDFSEAYNYPSRKRSSCCDDYWLHYTNELH